MLVGVALPPLGLIPSHWNIGILLHKQAKRRTIMHTTAHGFESELIYGTLLHSCMLIQCLQGNHCFQKVLTELPKTLKASSVALKLNIVVMKMIIQEFPA